MQNFLRDQEDVNRKSFNLLAVAARNLDKLTSDANVLVILTNEALMTIKAHLTFLVECLQGPCRLNQDFIVEETVVVLCAKRLIRMVHDRLFHGRMPKEHFKAG